MFSIGIQRSVNFAGCDLASLHHAGATHTEKDASPAPTTPPSPAPVDSPADSVGVQTGPGRGPELDGENGDVRPSLTL